MKSNIFTSILIKTIALFMIGCSQHEPYRSDEILLEKVVETEEAGSIPEIKESTPVVEQAGLLFDRKIVKKAECRFKVHDVDSITNVARRIAEKYLGYISDMRFRNDRFQLENRFTIRVPRDNFEDVLQELTNLATFVDFKNITSTDVSEEYIDLKTRLKTKIEVKKRYDDILKSKAKTVKEVLLAEEKLRVLQEEIEAAQGRLQFLTNKTALSTIQVDLYETVAYEEQPETFTKSFLTKAYESLSVGWHLLQTIVLGLLYAWPLLCIGFLIGLYLRYFKKKSAKPTD